MDPTYWCQGNGLVLSDLSNDQIATNARFFVLSLPNNEMSKKSPFVIEKALKGIGEPKSVKKLRSGDLLVETTCALQSKSYLSAKTFLDSPLTVAAHKSLNFCRGVISEPDLLNTCELDLLEGLKDQGVIQVRRIILNKRTSFNPTKHIILTFNTPKLPSTIKAGYLNCKIRPYVPNPLRCFKCQRFGHSQTSCRGQLTCSRCASVGHSSTNCNLEQKCVNCSEPHSSDSKLCSRFKVEKQIQDIKTKQNISYLEARKLVAPQKTQTYAQITKSTVSCTTQTDESLTKIIVPPLKCLTPLSYPAEKKSSTSSSLPKVTTSSSSTQAELLPSTSSLSESQNSVPVLATAPSTKDLQPSVLNSAIPTSNNQPPLSIATPAANVNTKIKKKRTLHKQKIDIKMAPHKPKKSAPVQEESDEEMIEYDVDESDVLLRRYGDFSHVMTPTRHKNGRNN